jgi:hypothetical protein
MNCGHSLRFQPRLFSFCAIRATPVVIDKRGDAGFGAGMRTAFELKRALSGQVSKLIKEMNEALKILSDTSERDLVEVGQLLGSVENNKVFYYDADNQTPAFEPMAQPGGVGVIQVAYDPTGSVVFVLGTDGNVRQWQFPVAPVPPPEFLHSLLTCVSGITFSTDAEKITTVRMLDRLRLRAELLNGAPDHSVWGTAMQWVLQDGIAEAKGPLFFGE